MSIKARPIWRRCGEFSGALLYETRWMPAKHAICIPEIGIILPCDHSIHDHHLLRHEYGHILQHKAMGRIRFYLKVGIPSLWSAFISRYGRHVHQRHAVELDANARSYAHFDAPWDWAEERFPLC